MYSPYPDPAGLRITKADNGWIVYFQEPIKNVPFKGYYTDLNVPSMGDYAADPDVSDVSDDEEDIDEDEWGRSIPPELGCFTPHPLFKSKTYVFVDKEALMKFISERIDE